MKTKLVTISATAIFLFSCGQSPKQNTGSETSEEKTTEAPAPEKKETGKEQHFSKTLNYGDFSYKVEVKGDAVSIQPEGFESSAAIEFMLDGQEVQGAEAGDLNKDGFPEVVLYTHAPGDTHLNVNGYSPNRGKSFSMFAWTPVDQNPDLKKGYQGHDEMTIIEGTLVQRFPLFGPDGNQIDKMRQIQYKLVDGEAMRQLKVDKVTEF